MRNLIVTSFFLLLLLGACQQEIENYDELVSDASIVNDYMEQLTDVIVHDIFSPPVAARNYVYPSIAGYEVIRHLDPNLQSFAGRLNGLSKIPEPDSDKKISFHLASLQAFHLVSKALIFSEDSLHNFHTNFIKELDTKGFPKEVKENSLAYGKKVSDAILKWSSTDNYKETRSFPKYTVDYEAGTWKPTPPAYLSSIEPHWNKIRTMVLDSATQFIPKPPTKFDLTKGSKFYIEMMEVYDAVAKADKEMTEIANFWDCNPYKMNQTGHVMFATKKITPGGHWIGITKIASEKSNLSFEKTFEAYAICSIALFDGFISCWDEKYRSKLIRPETVINEHFDENWLPILQTPPFPEHTSGHSVISRAAAVVLTDIFGENFAFEDDTELQYGLPIRSFESFKAASEEAAISRLYGGIHYRPAIDYGVEQGEKVGNFIVKKLEI
ncbi:vanadium-dependent haloperoxidase [Portibacter lacus]|nr:vanadium-dependent haloperoxidase [Portibacter lacus]